MKKKVKFLSCSLNKLALIMKRKRSQKRKMVKFNNAHHKKVLTKFIYKNNMYWIKGIPQRFAVFSNGIIVANFDKIEPVQDSIFGILKLKNNVISKVRFLSSQIAVGSFCKIIRGVKIERLTKCKKYKEYKKLIIILESPHKDEYSGTKELLPAQGSTGTQLIKKIRNDSMKLVKGSTGNKKIKDLMRDAVKLSSLLSDGKYFIFLVNPICYPASCYKFWQNVLNKKVKNIKRVKSIKEANTDFTHKIFEALFCQGGANLRQDFIKRLKQYCSTGDFIINCTTQPNSELVQKAVADAGHKINGTFYHPSSSRF